MLKKSTVSYNKDTMKTLDAKAIKTHKENLHAEFEEIKNKAVAYEKARAQCLERMSQLQGAYKAMEDLERQIGVKPTLPAKGMEKPAKN